MTNLALREMSDAEDFAIVSSYNNKGRKAWGGVLEWLLAVWPCVGKEAFMRRFSVLWLGTFLSAGTSFAGLLSIAPTLSVGKETFEATEVVVDGHVDYVSSSHRFSNCAAYATWTKDSGFTLTFEDDTEVNGNVVWHDRSWAKKGLVINVPEGRQVTLNGDIDNQEGYPLEIRGPGRLNISGSITPYSSYIRIIDADLEIKSPNKSSAISTIGAVYVESSVLLINGYGKVIQAMDGATFVSSIVSIHAEPSKGSRQYGAIEDGSYQNPGEGIEIRGCVMTIVENHSDADGILARGALKVLDSCIAVVSDGTCFNSPRYGSGHESCKALFSNAKVLGVSRTSKAVNVGMGDRDDHVAHFGEGEYFLASANAKSAITAGRIVVDAEKLECSAPSAYVCNTYGFTMSNGVFRVVDSIDGISHAREILSESAVQKVISANSDYSGWTNRRSKVLADMLSDVEAALEDVPEDGPASGLIETERFCQLGGEIDQGVSTGGCFVAYEGSPLTPFWHIPAFCGGSLKTDFKYKETGILGDNQYHAIAPTNALGQTLTRVDYKPYWVYLGGGDTLARYEVVFDANGGTCGTSSQKVDKDATIGKLPTPSRDGYEFLGWYTAATGGTKITGSTVVTNNMTLYAHWQKQAEADLAFYVPDRMPASFYLYREGAGNVSVTELEEGEALRVTCYFTNKGARSVSNFKIQFQVGDKKWAASKYEKGYFNQGDEGWVSAELLSHNLSVGEYDMTCTLDSGNTVSETNEENNTQTIHFRIAPKGSLNLTVTLKLNAVGGSVSPKSLTYPMGATCGELPVPTRSGYVFKGWFTSEYYPHLGKMVNASTVITKDSVFYAVWDRLEAIDEISGFPDIESSAMTYNGYLYRSSDQNVVGVIEVKISKLSKNKKSGKSTAKVTVGMQLAGESKKLSTSVSGDCSHHSLSYTWKLTLPVKGRGDLELKLGKNGMFGSFEGYSIEGVPNIFVLKDADSKAASSAADAAYRGVYNLVADEGSFALNVGTKGKVKVSGTTADGKKVSASTQLIVGEGKACIPVVVSKTAIAFNVWLGEDIQVIGLPNALFGNPGTLSENAIFGIEASELANLIGDDTYAEFFPSGLSVTQSGNKWIVAGGAKAGKVSLSKDGTIDRTKTRENPSALKLTYSATTGSFKGSFKAYVNNKGKPKAITVNVAGVMIDGTGYGSATVKRSGSCSVTIAGQE